MTQSGNQLETKRETGQADPLLSIVPCEECDRLSRNEIALTHRASEAETRLQLFSPEPPFGEAAVQEFRACERRAEESRASLLRAREERLAHTSTHVMTIRM